MGLIIKNRTIRPSTRSENSPYRIKVENPRPDDDIVIFIDHESRDYRSIYKCKGELFRESDSLYFNVEGINDKISIKWRNSEPELIK